MALSEEEQRILSELERDFAPKNAEENEFLGAGLEEQSLEGGTHISLSPTMLAIAALSLVVGLVVLIVAVNLGIGKGSVVGVLGFLIMLYGVTLPWRKREKSSTKVK